MPRLALADTLQRVLAHDPSLTEVAVAEPLDAEAVGRLAAALENNPHVTAVDVGGNGNVGAEGARHMARVLRASGSLVRLDMHRCDVGAEGVRHLADALKANTVLRDLRLDANNIGAGLRALGDAVQVNVALESLDVRCNHASLEDCRHMANALQFNRSLVDLLLIGDQNVTDGDVEMRLRNALEHNRQRARFMHRAEKREAAARFAALARVRTRAPDPAEYANLVTRAAVAARRSPAAEHVALGDLHIVNAQNRHGVLGVTSAALLAAGSPTLAVCLWAAHAQPGTPVSVDEALGRTANTAAVSATRQLLAATVLMELVFDARAHRFTLTMPPDVTPAESRAVCTVLVHGLEAVAVLAADGAPRDPHCVKLVDRFVHKHIVPNAADADPRASVAHAASCEAVLRAIGAEEVWLHTVRALEASFPRDPAAAAAWLPAWFLGLLDETHGGSVDASPVLWHLLVKHAHDNRAPLAVGPVLLGISPALLAAQSPLLKDAARIVITGGKEEPDVGHGAEQQLPLVHACSLGSGAPDESQRLPLMALVRREFDEGTVFRDEARGAAALLTDCVFGLDARGRIGSASVVAVHGVVAAAASPMWSGALSRRGEWLQADGVHRVVGIKTRAGLCALISFVYTTRLPSPATLEAWLRADGVIPHNATRAVIDALVLGVLVDLSLYAGSDQHLVRSPMCPDGVTLVAEAARIACDWIRARESADLAQDVAAAARRAGCTWICEAACAWLIASRPDVDMTLEAALEEQLHARCVEADLRDEIARLDGEIARLAGETSGLRELLQRVLARLDGPGPL